MGAMRAAAALETVAVTRELVMQLRRPVEVELSPDGSRVAFTLAPGYRRRGGTGQSRPREGETRAERAPAAEAGTAPARPSVSTSGSAPSLTCRLGTAGRV